jgi:hypothetical protein
MGSGASAIGGAAIRISWSFGRQHFLYFLPLPQGQGSLRPAFMVLSFPHLLRAGNRNPLMIWLSSELACMLDHITCLLTSRPTREKPSVLAAYGIAAKKDLLEPSLSNSLRAFSPAKLAIHTHDRESQVVEGRNWPASGSTAVGYTINLGHTPESLHSPSRAAPSESATCEGEGRIGNSEGSASRSEGYGSREEALPEYCPDMMGTKWAPFQPLPEPAIRVCLKIVRLQSHSHATLQPPSSHILGSSEPPPCDLQATLMRPSCDHQAGSTSLARKRQNLLSALAGLGHAGGRQT